MKADTRPIVIGPCRSWEDLQPRLDERDKCRVWFEPVGDLPRELAFVFLNAPVMALLAGPLGVTFHCADGGVYHLSTDGDIDQPLEWRIRLLLKL